MGLAFPPQGRLFTDSHPHNCWRSGLARLQTRRHPYSNQQVINWRYRCVNGRNILAMAIIRYSQTLPDSPYGETFEDYNTPKATPDHSTYSHVVLVKHKGIVRMVRFG